jgi:signal peptidase I
MRSVDLHAALYWPGKKDLNQDDYALFKWIGKDPQSKGLNDGMILLKRVACGPGQRLKVTPVQFFCDGQAGEFLRLKDSKGRPVRPFLYNGIIPPGKYFMIGDNPLSYDSRYWGFIDKNQIVGKVIFGL